MQPDENEDSDAASAESNDAEMLSPEEQALYMDIQKPGFRPPSPPKREIPRENEE